ncbi:venom carboxylesterase-6-like [Thrips palmi]|uniref:Carboxylic ester hydrolase n=1 Tax=Thrips palmi TaxID=161013 RepID=A0A6P9A3H6_THRPL|nr:venom carboxylesterase-6-like [Thrips palmi]
MATVLPAVAALALAALAALAALPAVVALPLVPAISYNGGQGIITGARLRSGGLHTARDYAAFWGVPYAEPPVGKLRFKPPQGRDLPDGMFAATNVSTPECIQQSRHPLEIHGAEDCLTLQIYTPNYDNPVLPVLVLIHGGGFMFGRGPREGVQFVMDHDVVLVNVDYRVGLLGYMSFEDDTLRGNLGMLDQVEALRWVQRNIHLFGGDNKNVTLVGNSAGSASCLLHTMSPLSKGLFHRVIGMSGTPLNPWTRQYSARENAHMVANLTGCDAPTTAEKISCLQNQSATDLVALQGTHFQHWMNNPFSPFAPVVDGVFLTEEPGKLLNKRGAVMDVPLLLSFTSDEGLYTAGEFIMNDALVRELDENWETVAPQLLHMHDKRVPEADKPDLVQKARKFYLGNQTLVAAKSELVKLMSDRNFVAGLADYVTRRAKDQSSAVFVSEFAHRGQFGLYPGVPGVSHADDFQYYIEFTWWSGIFTRPEDIAVRKNLIDMWVAFAETSNPSIHGIDWRPTDGKDGSVNYLRIAGPEDKDMAMAQDKDLGNANFWRDLRIEPNHSGRVQASLVLCLASFGALLLGNARTS